MEKDITRSEPPLSLVSLRLSVSAKWPKDNWKSHFQ